MLEAITFDFWDTIAVDDSDETRRAAIGLPSKAETRMAIFVDHVTSRHPGVSASVAEEAFHAANARFRHEWHEHHYTPAVSTRISYAFEHLGLLPEAGKYGSFLAEMNALVREIEIMEVQISPVFASGIHQALAFLAQRYRLGIISDTIHTNGRGLRGLLGREGLLQYFEVTLFSDEVGISKPESAVFRYASHSFGVPTSLMAHVGDRESNDVAGPHSAGARAILYTGVINRGSDRTRADAVCSHFSDLPSIVHRMAQTYAPARW